MDERHSNTGLEAPPICYPALSIFSPLVPALIRQQLAPLLYSPSIQTEEPPSISPLSSLTKLDMDPETNLLPNHSQYDSRSSRDDTTYGSDDDAASNGGTQGTVSPNYESISGVRWNRVHPALNLLRNASYEAQQPQSDSHFVRALYINALRYLLAALPEDLTREESATIRRGLPQTVRADLNVRAGVSSMAEDTHPRPGSRAKMSFMDSIRGTAKPPPPPPPATRSHLHRLLASSIVWFFLLVQFLMPFVKVVLVQVYQYERSHRGMERVMAATVSLANRVGKRGVSFGSMVVDMDDGRVGVAALNLAAWWVEGIAGGICEGVGEGLTILGVNTHPGESNKGG